MARKKRTITVEEEPDEPREKEDLLPGELDELEKAQAIEEWLGDFQSRFTDQPVKVLVEKFEEGDWSICRKYPLGTFDHEAVRDEFGGGKYRATLFDPGGHYIKGGRNHFKFAPPVIKKDTPSTVANPLDNPVVSMMLKSMESQSSMLLGITQSIIQANAGKTSGGLAEVVEATKAIQALSPRGEKPLDNFKETLGIMKLVKEVTGDEGESKGGIMSEIREFLELYPMIKETLPQLKAGLATATPIPTPAAPVPSVTSGPKSPDQMDPLTKKIVALVPQFVGAAKANAPVETWSEFLLDNLETEIMPVLVPQFKAQYGPLVQNEDDAYDILIRYAKDPASRDTIYTSVPPLSPYKVWCDQVIEAAIKTLTEEDNGANIIVDAVSTPGNGHTLPT